MATTTVSQSVGASKVSFICGIIAGVLGIAPLASGWFLMLIWLVWILAILSIVFGVIAYVKKQPMLKPLIGIVVAIFGVFCPKIFSDKFEDSVVDSAGSVASFAKRTTDSAMGAGGEDDDHEDEYDYTNYHRYNF